MHACMNESWGIRSESTHSEKSYPTSQIPSYPCKYAPIAKNSTQLLQMLDPRDERIMPMKAARQVLQVNNIRLSALSPLRTKAAHLLRNVFLALLLDDGHCILLEHAHSLPLPFWLAWLPHS